jgi:4-amino-4-deoxy-L-arabinose transferase-like glycosyltransferase
MHTQSDDTPVSEKWRAEPLTSQQRLIASAIVAVYLFVTLALAFTARPQSDEAVYANPGYNLIHSGKMGMTIYELRGYLPLSTAERTYVQPPLYFLVSAVLFQVVGFGLHQVRLLSIFFGLVCLFSWYKTVRSLGFPQSLGLLVMGLISVDYFFLIGASHGRMDMMCVGLGSAGLAIYTNLRTRNLFRAVFWGNAMAALAMLTHPAGIVWAAAVLLAILMFDLHSFSVKLLAVAALPYLLAAVSWGAYILQDPVAFRDQLRGNLLVNKGSFDYSHLSHFQVLGYLEQEIITRYAAPFGLLGGVSLASRLKILVLVAYLTGVFGIILVKRLRVISTFLWFSIIFLSGFFLLAEISPSKFAYYLPHTTVMMAACLGIFLYSVTRSPQWRLIFAVAILIGFIQIGGAANVIRQNEYRSTFVPVIHAIERNSRPNSTIMSEAELWFGLWRDRTVLDDPLLGFLSGIHPDVFVMNPVFQALHERDRRTNPAGYEHVQRLIEQSRMVYKDSYNRVYVTDVQAGETRTGSPAP